MTKENCTCTESSDIFCPTCSKKIGINGRLKVERATEISAQEMVDYCFAHGMTITKATCDFFLTALLSFEKQIKAEKKGEAFRRGYSVGYEEGLKAKTK